MAKWHNLGYPFSSDIKMELNKYEVPCNYNIKDSNWPF